MTDGGSAKEHITEPFFLSHLHPNSNIVLATLISLPSTSLSFSDSFCHLLSLCFLHFTQRLLSLFTSLICSVTGVTQLLKCVKEMAFQMSPKSYLIFAVEIGCVCIVHPGCTFSTAHFQSQVAHLPTLLLSVGCFRTFPRD